MSTVQSLPPPAWGSSPRISERPRSHRGPWPAGSPAWGRQVRDRGTPSNRSWARRGFAGVLSEKNRVRASLSQPLDEHGAGRRNVIAVERSEEHTSELQSRQYL